MKRREFIALLSGAAAAWPLAVPGTYTMTLTVSDRHPIFAWATFRRGLNYIAGLIGIGLTYFVLAKSGLALALIHPSASPIWPPTGFALAAILLWGYRAWPAIFLGAMMANATTNGSMSTAISIATGNSLEALVGAAVINVWSNGRDTFSTPNTVAKFAAICVVLATPISATVGITTLVIAGYAEWANFANIWLTWWAGDMIGALVVTPLVVLCALSDARAFRRTELTKSAAVISLAVAVGFIAFNIQTVATPGHILSCRLTAVVGRIAARPPRYGDRIVYPRRLFDLGNAFGRRTIRARQPQRRISFGTGVFDQRQRSKLSAQCRCRDAKNDRRKSASNA